MSERCPSASGLIYLKAIETLAGDVLRSLSMAERAPAGPDVREYPDPAQLWEAGIEKGVDHLFKRVHQNHLDARTDAERMRSIRVLWELGEEIASSICTSKSLRSSLARPYRDEEVSDGAKDLLKNLHVTSNEGEGRRLRMELLVAGWMLLYWHGYRNEVIAAGVLRLATIQSAFPFGLCFWLFFGLNLDNDRYALSQAMAMDDIYSIRSKPLILVGDGGTAPEIPLCHVLRRLAHLYGQLQAALTLKSPRDTGHTDLFHYHLVLSGEAVRKGGEGEGNEEKRAQIDRRIKAWDHFGAHIVSLSPEQLANLGSGLFCNLHGIGYFGPDNDADAGGGLINYRGYQIERESLMQRRREAADLVRSEKHRAIRCFDDLYA